MVDKVSFKGFVRLAPKVEEAIMEKEYYALQRKFKDLADDVFVKTRNVIKENGNQRETFFECYSKPNNRCLSTLITTPKTY